jgi:tetratricopeptide (TPR) repeat protein
MPRLTTVCAVALIVILPARAAAQKDAFIDAFIAFHSALAGTYGDEGARVTASLERMATSLDAWERSNTTAEAAMKARPEATPAEFALLYLEQGRLADAIRAMEAAIAAEPRRAALHLFVGFLHDAAGHAAEAAAAFRTAWEIEPSEPIHAYLAAEHRPAGAGDDALAPLVAAMMAADGRAAARSRTPFMQLALIDDASAKTPVFAPAAYAAGFALMAQGRYRNAVEQFRGIVAIDPLVADPAGRHEQVRQGIAALKERRADAAIAHFEAAVAALPKSSEAHRILGVGYRATGKLAESSLQFEAAVTLAPRDERARVALGTTRAEAGDLASAERVLRETIAALPASGEAHWALADVYEALDRGPEAVTTLEAATSFTVPAGKAALYWRIAELAHRHQDYGRVIVALSRRARLLPNEAGAHKDAGLAYARAGRNDEALIELLMASLLGPEDAEMLGTIGQIHLTAGRFDAADVALRRAIALDPALPQARYALGSTLQRLGRSAEAKEQLDEFQRLRAAALEEQRRAFEIATLIHEAELAVRAGKLDAAVAPYEKAAALGAEPDVYKQLADIYGKLGRTADRDKALAAYEQRRGH